MGVGGVGGWGGFWAFFNLCFKACVSQVIKRLLIYVTCEKPSNSQSLFALAVHALTLTKLTLNVYFLIGYFIWIFIEEYLLDQIKMTE